MKVSEAKRKLRPIVRELVREEISRALLSEVLATRDGVKVIERVLREVNTVSTTGLGDAVSDPAVMPGDGYYTEEEERDELDESRTPRRKRHKARQQRPSPEPQSERSQYRDIASSIGIPAELLEQAHNSYVQGQNATPPTAPDQNVMKGLFDEDTVSFMSSLAGVSE